MARALVYNKLIVIFDGATSNIDIYSETQINGLLETRLKYKTVIFITHKREILQKMDKIILMDEGKIILSGKFKELYDTNDRFKKLIDFRV